VRGLRRGDGKAPLKIEGNAFSGRAHAPKVRIGDLRGEIAVDKGTAKLKGIESKSADGEVSLEGEVSLRDPVVNSVINAYLRFKLSDAFLKSASTMQTILQMAGAAGKRPDGSYGLRHRAGVWARPRCRSPRRHRSVSRSCPFAPGRGPGSRPRTRRRWRAAGRARPPRPSTASGENPPPPPPAEIPQPPPPSPPPPAQQPPPPDVQQAPGAPAPPPAPVVDQPRGRAGRGAPAPGEEFQ